MEEKEDNTAVFALRDGWYERAKSKDMTLETLPAFLQELAAHEHDYNTICYAVTAAALAAAWAMNRTPNGGITGFQGGAVMWEFIQEWNCLRGKHLRLVDYSDMLYPQHEDKFRTISESTSTWLKDEAAKQLLDSEHMHPRVRAHMEAVAAGYVPFGYRLANS